MKIIKYMRHPKKILIWLGQKGILPISDKKFLELLFKDKMGYPLDLNNPKTFNEKLQWLKLYDHKPEYTKMVDKYEAKKYVAGIIGEKYIIPTLGIYNKFDEIDFDSLPNQFVIKCTHDSGGLVICTDKKNFDIEEAKRKIQKFLKRKFYYAGREWPYKNVKPRIIVEKYMKDNKTKTMRDYKFFCFDGIPKLMYLSEGLEDHSTARMSFYDMDMKLSDCTRKDYKPLEYIPRKPKTFDKMKNFSTILSSEIPHVRVDWYEINNKLYFGELTFYTCNGMVPFASSEWDRKLGDLINLDLVKK